MSTKYAIFLLNGEEYGLDISKVSTVEKDIIIKNMANSPANVKGKISLRGNELPVYSLRKKLGFEDRQPDKFTRFLISDVNGIDIAIEVDRVKGIIDIEESHIYDAPQVIKCNSTSYIKSIATAGEGLVLILDNDFILDKDEIEAIKQACKSSKN